MYSPRRLTASATLLVGALLLAACGRATPPMTGPAAAGTPAPGVAASATASVAIAASPTPTGAVTAYGFTITPPAAAAVQPIGLLTDQADATSGALDGSAGNLTFVLVWNAGFHDANAALQAGFDALGARGAQVTSSGAAPMTEGNLDAVGRTFEITTTTGTATGFAAAWGCGQPQRTFALVARGEPGAAQQDVRDMLRGFACQP